MCVDTFIYICSHAYMCICMYIYAMYIRTSFWVLQVQLTCPGMFGISFDSKSARLLLK